MSTPLSPHEVLRHKSRRLTAVCLLLWLGVTLVPVLTARSGWTLGPWPIDFWMAAQGSLIVFCLIVVVYARVMARLDEAHDVAEEP